MKIGVAGYTGRVGKILVSELQSGAWPDLELAAGSCRALHPEHAGAQEYPVFTNARDLTAICDCVIDFTAPVSTLTLAAAAAQTKTALVIGTTGLSEEDENTLEQYARNIPIVYAANMSVGVTLLLSLVEMAAARLGPSWDIEIFETHHRNKLDAPSGTALALGKAAQAGRGGNPPFTCDRAGRREGGAIGFASSRGGDVVGEHDVTFYGAGERLTLSHKAGDRALFAHGGLTAARWVTGKPPGLYSMRDVLDLP